jgi:hypothetical protein
MGRLLHEPQKQKLFSSLVANHLHILESADKNVPAIWDFHNGSNITARLACQS